MKDGDRRGVKEGGRKGKDVRREEEGCKGRNGGKKGDIHRRDKGLRI